MNRLRISLKRPKRKQISEGRLSEEQIRHRQAVDAAYSSDDPIKPGETRTIRVGEREIIVVRLRGQDESNT